MNDVAYHNVYIVFRTIGLIYNVFTIYIFNIYSIYIEYTRHDEYTIERELPQTCQCILYTHAYTLCSYVVKNCIATFDFRSGKNEWALPRECSFSSAKSNELTQ